MNFCQNLNDSIIAEYMHIHIHHHTYKRNICKNVNNKFFSFSCTSAISVALYAKYFHDTHKFWTEIYRYRYLFNFYITVINFQLICCNLLLIRLSEYLQWLFLYEINFWNSFFNQSEHACPCAYVAGKYSHVQQMRVSTLKFYKRCYCNLHL